MMKCVQICFQLVLVASTCVLKCISTTPRPEYRPWQLCNQLTANINLSECSRYIHTVDVTECLRVILITRGGSSTRRTRCSLLPYGRNTALGNRLTPLTSVRMMTSSPPKRNLFFYIRTTILLITKNYIFACFNQYFWFLCLICFCIGWFLLN